ncbi:MAG: hypothetical protein ABSC50_01710 [Candidatus Bathyarchaeia archaeon]
MQRSELQTNYWDRTVERIFNLDQGIRYVGISDLEYHVIVSKMRPGTSSLTPSELDWNFVSMAPKIMVDSAQRLEENCGPLQIMSVRYRRVLLAIYRSSQHIVMLSFESTVESPFLNKLAKGLESIMH